MEGGLDSFKSFRGCEPLSVVRKRVREHRIGVLSGVSHMTCREAACLIACVYHQPQGEELYGPG